MLKMLTAVAFAIALPAAALAQPANPAGPQAGQAQPCPTGHEKMAGMDQSKMAGMDRSNMAGMDMSKMDHSKLSDMSGMDRSKMMDGCHSMAKPATATPQQGHSGH